MGYGLIMCSNQALVFLALFFVLLKPLPPRYPTPDRFGLSGDEDCGLEQANDGPPHPRGTVIFHHGPDIPGFRHCLAGLWCHFIVVSLFGLIFVLFVSFIELIRYVFYRILWCKLFSRLHKYFGLWWGFKCSWRAGKPLLPSHGEYPLCLHVLDKIVWGEKHRPSFHNPRIHLNRLFWTYASNSVTREQFYYSVVYFI